MIRLASASAFEPPTEREHQARVRAAEIVAGFRAIRAALNDAEQAFLSAGIESANGHLASAERAISALRGSAKANAIDTLQPVTAQVMAPNPEAWR